MFKETMYFQGWQPLDIIEAHRLWELQQLHSIMSKQPGISPFKPFSATRSLGSFERSTSMHAESLPQREQKQLTSFRIRDILSDRTQEEVIGSHPVQPDCPSVEKCSKNLCTCRPVSTSSSESSDSCTSSQVTTVNRYKCRNGRMFKSERSFVRPWSATSRSESKNTNVTSESAIGATACHNGGKDAVDVTDKGTVLRHGHVSDDEVEIDVESCDTEDNAISLTNLSTESSPLDALVAMSSRAFLGLENYDNQKNAENGHSSRNQVSKKKRKTRTAFTNQQIYELEKRFIMQKYLTPVDRDDIANKLGLTCAQVITWFQNRRAKFKRDLEEMKSDIVATSPTGGDTVRDCSE